MKRENQLARNTLIIAIGTFLPKLASFITLPIVTAALTQTEYGAYDLISTLASLFLPIATLQIQTAAFRFLIDCRDNDTDRKRVITNIYAFLIPTSLVALGILYGILCGMGIELSTRLLICLYFATDILYLTTQQIIRGLSRNKMYSTAAVINALINMLLVVLLVAMKKQHLHGVLWALILSHFISFVFLLFVGHIVKNIDIRLISAGTIKSMLAYAWPMIPNSLSNWALNFSDRSVLSLWDPTLGATAVFSVASKIPSLFTTVQSTFVFAWQENASIASKDNDVDAYYSNMFDTIYRMLVGIMAMLIATAPLLFLVLVRGDYDKAYPQMPILFMGMLFSAMSSFLGGIYVAHKKTKSVGITTVIAAVINLAIDLSCVWLIGVYAASVSTLVSYVFLTLYRMRDIRKFQPLRINLRTFILCLAGLAVMCVLFWIKNPVLLIVNGVVGTAFAVFVNRKLLLGILDELRRKRGSVSSAKGADRK